MGGGGGGGGGEAIFKGVATEGGGLCAMGIVGVALENYFHSPPPPQPPPPPLHTHIHTQIASYTNACVSAFKNRVWSCGAVNCVHAHNIHDPSN